MGGAEGFLVLAAALMGALMVVSAHETSGELFGASVVTLTDHDWEHDYRATLQGPTFVMYYAAWCGQCKRLAPTWTELAELVQSKRGEWGALRVAAVQASEERGNPGSPFVKGYPTFLFLMDGEVVGVHEEEWDLESLSTYAYDMQKRFRVDNSAAEKQHAVKDEAQLKCARKETALLDKQKTKRHFEATVTELTDSSYFKKTRGNFTLLFIYAEWCSDSTKMFPIFISLASLPTAYPEVVRIARLKGTDHKSHPASRHVQDYPTILFLDRDSAPIAKLKGGDHSVVGIKKWAERFAQMDAFDRKAAKMALEQEASAGEQRAKEEQQESAQQRQRADVAFQAAVPELTNGNFHEQTRAKDAVVLYYVDDHGPCEALKPVWTQLSAAANISSPALLVARILGPFHKFNSGVRFVEAYPTVLFHRNGLPISKFNGNPTLTALQQWLASVSADKNPQSLSAKMEQADRQKREEERRRQQDQETRIRKAKEEEKRRAKLQERRSKRVP